MYPFAYHAHLDWSEREIWQLSILVDFSPLKLLVFRLVITYFGTPQFAPDHTIFVKTFLGEHVPGPPPPPTHTHTHTPSNSVCTQCYGPTNTCYFIIFLGYLPFLKEFLKMLIRYILI